MNGMYIDDEADAELVCAWQTLGALRGTADGWQYRGSSPTEQGWQHHFRNRQILEEAESDAAAELAYALVLASPDWRPQS